jgi:hypothetical protein
MKTSLKVLTLAGVLRAAGVSTSKRLAYDGLDDIFLKRQC